MIVAVYNLATGLLTGIAEGVVNLSTFHVDDGHALLQIAEKVDWATSRVVDGDIVQIPARPGPSFVWDNTLESWVDATPLSELKSGKRKAIEEDRERRNLSPILFQGNPFDADATAQRNVSAWMVNIANGQTPPAGFTWRGFDNVDHPANSTFIVGLGNAITLRGSYLYQRSWIKKAEVDALTTAQDVNAYDAKANW